MSDFYVVRYFGGRATSPDDIVESPVPEILMGKQGKHMIGRNHFKGGRNVLTADPRELAVRAGTGVPANNVPRGMPGFHERVAFDEVIGEYFEEGAKVGMPTKNAIIHYSKKGIHIVPARP